MKKNISTALVLGVIMTTGSAFAQIDTRINLDATTSNQDTSVRVQTREQNAAMRLETQTNSDVRVNENAARREAMNARAQERKAQAEARIEEAKKAREEKKNEAQEVRKENLMQRKAFAQRGFTQVISVIDSRILRVEAMISTAAAQGVVTAEATASLTESKRALAEAKSALQTLESTPAQAENSTTVQTTRANAQAVHTHLKTSRGALVESIQSLKAVIVSERASSTTNITTE